MKSKPVDVKGGSWTGVESSAEEKDKGRSENVEENMKDNCSLVEIELLTEVKKGGIMYLKETGTWERSKSMNEQ